MKRPYKKNLRDAQRLIEDAQEKLKQAIPLVSDDTQGSLQDLIEDAFNDILVSVMCDQEDDNWDVREGEKV